MKYLLLLLSFLWINQVCNSQASLSINNFLATAKAQESILLKNKTIDFLKNTSHDLPWIDELELRTRSHDFEISQQEYIFRLTPNSPRQRESQKKFHRSNIYFNEIGQQLLLEEALLDRYQIIVNIFFYEQLIQINNQFSLVYEDEINVLRKSVLSSDFDIADLIKAEDDLNTINLEILSLKNTLTNLQISVMELSESKASLRINPEEIISISEIKNLSHGLFDSLSYQHPLLSQRQAKIDMIQYEYELEDAERRNMVDFLESRFEGQRNDFFKERFSVGLGLKLPIKGSAKLKLNELKLEQFEEENKQKKLAGKLESKKSEAFRTLEMRLAEYTLLQDQMKNSQALFSIDQYPELAEASAYTLLKIKESLLRKQLDIIDKCWEVYKIFIDLLQLSGRVTQLPLRNYLSPGADFY